MKPKFSSTRTRLLSGVQDKLDKAHHSQQAMAIFTIVEVVGEEQHRGPQGELESLGVLERSITPSSTTDNCD